MRFRSPRREQPSIAGGDDQLPQIVMYLMDGGAPDDPWREPQPDAVGSDSADGEPDPDASAAAEHGPDTASTPHGRRPSISSWGEPASYARRPRRGCPEEILVTMLGNPADRVGEVVPGSFFRHRIAQLHVDAGSITMRDRTVEWRANLRTHPWRRRRATLRMFGSTSTNVTVLTLTPDRPHRVLTRAFVRAGWRAMTELRDRIEFGVPRVPLAANGPAPRTG